MKDVWVYYKGYDVDKDAVIRDIMEGFEQCGSGYSMLDDERDINFFVPDEMVESCVHSLEARGFRVKVLDEA